MISDEVGSERLGEGSGTTSTLKHRISTLFRYDPAAQPELVKRVLFYVCAVSSVTPLVGLAVLELFFPEELSRFLFLFGFGVAVSLSYTTALIMLSLGKVRLAAWISVLTGIIFIGLASLSIGLNTGLEVNAILPVLLASIVLGWIPTVVITLVWGTFIIGLYFFQKVLMILPPFIVLSDDLFQVTNLVLNCIGYMLVLTLLIFPGYFSARALKLQSESLRRSLYRQAKSEKLLQENEQRLQATFEQIAIGIAEINIRGEFDRINTRFGEIFNYSEADLRGMCLLELFDEEDRPTDFSDFTANFDEASGMLRTEKRYHTSDHRIGWAVFSLTRIINDLSEVKSYVLTVQEVTARKRYEKELAEEKERLVVTLRSIGEGVLTTDINGTVELLNPVAENLLGWTQLEVFGKPVDKVFRLIDSQTRQPAPNPVTRAVKQGRIVGLLGRTLVVSSEGREFPISCSASPIRDQSNVITGVVLVFRDITERRRLEEQEERSQRLESLGVLAGGIAHDFNNILTAISANIALARMESDLPTETIEILDEAENAALRARDLTQQLLTFSRGGSPIKKSALLGDLLRETTEFALRGSRVKCDFAIPENLWTVEIDAGQISQVVNNLVLNAVQAMPEGGKIVITCQNIAATSELLSNTPLAENQDYVQVSFADTGPGIPPEIINRIFDPYFTNKRKGTGLGLTMCYSIIARHSGYIEAKSLPGEGATFTLYLPATLAALPVKTTTNNGLTRGSGLVLLMDDDAMIRHVTSRALRNLGYEVLEASNGSEAINIYRDKRLTTSPVELLILDLTVPGEMGGKDVMRVLSSEFSNVKAIVSSGYSNDTILAKYEDYGFCDALVKPFRLSDLSQKVNRAFEQVTPAQMP